MFQRAVQMTWTVLIILSIINRNCVTCQNNFSFVQNPVINFMLQTASPAYTPQNPSDPFDILRDTYPLPGDLKSPLSEYDYIIVGAGSAGCVLAARLTEDPNVTVLLLEAGRPENFFTDVPIIAPFFQLTEYAWPYFMETQAGLCLGMLNKKCYWPRGRAVGGTSIINYMIYTRGRPEEWDRIADAGNYGCFEYNFDGQVNIKWEQRALAIISRRYLGTTRTKTKDVKSYDEVLKYYMKSERANLKGYDSSLYRGKNGDMDVEFVNVKTPLIKAFLEAGRILGSPTVDYNNPEQLGFGYVQTNTRAGKRLSAAKAFLHPNKKRPNLHILPLATVTKVLINNRTKTALGVEYIRNHLKNEVKARREVILSAGPIASPQLLMLSGIGPREHLTTHGISVIQNLPVGRTLYDHITYPGLIFTLNTTNISFIENRLANIQNVLKWLQFGDNELGSPGGVEGIGYIKTPLSRELYNIPDIELISIGGSLVADGGARASNAVRRGMMISPEIFDKAFGAIDGTDTWSVFPMLLHPKSVGYLKLKDSNPFSHPQLYGNYYMDPIDVATMIAAIRYVQALVATPPFQKFETKMHKAHYITCPSLSYDSDEYWECALRTLPATLHHQIATCRMGPRGDPLAVVDPELKVHGVHGLRVVDSSILPRTISAHTHAPAVMIGEKAADMIKTTSNIRQDH